MTNEQSTTPVAQAITVIEKKNLPRPNLLLLKRAFKGKTKLYLFYLTWIKHNLNAGDAYQELHPEVTYGTARTLGSRLLKKVDRSLIMEAYDLDTQKYFQQLKDGVEAMKADMIGQLHPDHKTRAIYHDKLGKLLGIEVEKGNNLNAVQVNVNLDKYIK